MLLCETKYSACNNRAKKDFETSVNDLGHYKYNDHHRETVAKETLRQAQTKIEKKVAQCKSHLTACTRATLNRYFHETYQ